jgi:two-component system sensor histidine kinase UhpB
MAALTNETTMLTSKLELMAQNLAVARKGIASFGRTSIMGAIATDEFEATDIRLIAQIERELDLFRQELTNLLPHRTQPFVVPYRLQGASMALFHQDRQLRYVWASPNFRIHDDQEWLGKRDEDLLPPASAAYLTQIKRAVLESGQGHCEVVLSPLRGQSRYLELLLEPWRDAQGQIIGVVGACTDVTQRRQVQGEKERQQALMRQQQSQLQQLNLHLAMLQATAERDISRHLHDRVGSALTVLHLVLTLAAREVLCDSPRLASVQKLLEDALQLTSQISDGVSKVVDELRPPHLENEGLATALHWYLNSAQHRVDLAMTLTADREFPRLEPVAEYELYLIAQEAITNAIKYSRAQQLTVVLEATAQTVRMVIADNGVGIDLACLDDPAHPTAHWGLINMAERAELIGGSCKVVSQPGAGTQIVVEMRR